MYIYTEIQGLFKVKLNPYENNIRYSNLVNEDKLNFYINSVKFIDRTFYAISKNNSIVYEFINYTYKKKPFNLFDYVQNEYEVNENVELSLIKQPYYVKAIFFQMNTNSIEMSNIEDGNISIFKKRKLKSYNMNLNYSNNDNKFISSNQNLFSNRKKNENSLFMNQNNSINRVSKISSMLGNLFEMKIKNYLNKTKLLQNSEGNAFLLGKKRIELIRMDYLKSEGVNLLANEAMNDFYLDTNAFNMANNMLNIPINENYYNDRNKSIVFDEERKDDDFNNQKFNFDNESPINNNNYNNNGFNNNILPYDNFENNENNKQRANSSQHNNINDIYKKNKLNDNFGFNDISDNNNKLRGRSTGNYLNNGHNYYNNNNFNDDNLESI